MKQLYTGNISDGASMPIKKGTLDFLQQSYQELFAELLFEVNPNLDFSPGKINVLRNAYVIGSGTSWSIEAGAILFNGEILIVQAGSITSSNPTLSLTIGQVTAPDADPVTFTDGNSYNIHNVRTAVLTDNDTSANLICAVSEALNINLVYTNEWHCIMGQNGTNPPGKVLSIANTFPNVIDFSFAYATQGSYTFTLGADCLTLDKTIVKSSLMLSSVSKPLILMPQLTSTSQITLFCYDKTGALVDIDGNFDFYVKVYN